MWNGAGHAAARRGRRNLCTLTWVRSDDGYQLFFNRDELRSRGPEIPPALLRVGERQVIAPLDSDASGTWIGVNDEGVAAALLNGYHVADGDLAFTPLESRGRIVLELLGAADESDARDRLLALDPTRYRSFHVAVFARGAAPFVASSDRSSLTIQRGEPQMPLFSSSFREPEVAIARRGAFEALAGPLEPATLVEYHRSHARGESAYSVCMHRDDAETRSFTRVIVDRGSVALEHAPGSPCRGHAARRVAIDLAAPRP
jgi:hypothetical protein